MISQESAWNGSRRRPTEEMVQQVFSHLNEQGMLLDSRCVYGVEGRSTLFRFEIDLPDAVDLEDLQLQLAGELTKALPAFSAHYGETPDSGIHPVFHLTRAGHALPPAADEK